jgi:phage protein U
MMLSLGLFGFALDTLAYQEFSRRTDWKHGRTPRFGARDAHQFIGPGTDNVQLRGYLLPEFAGKPASLDELRDMAGGGEPFPLVAGDGRVYGNFIITGIEEGRTDFFSDGTARRIEFTIDLSQVED